MPSLSTTERWVVSPLPGGAAATVPGHDFTSAEEVARRGLNRDDLRQRLRRDRSSGRRKPYVFRFKSPDKSYSLALTFRQSEVDRDDLIRALEKIVSDLRSEAAR